MHPKEDGDTYHQRPRNHGLTLRDPEKKRVVGAIVPDRAFLRLWKRALLERKRPPRWASAGMHILRSA
jgi:hypothetical protein